MYVDDIKLASKTENIETTWKIVMEDLPFKTMIFAICALVDVSTYLDILTLEPF